MWFEATGGFIDEIGLVARSGADYYPEWRKQWESWLGPIRFPDGFKVSSLEVRPEDFEKHVGQPDEREEDDVEIVLTYNDSPKFRGFFFDAEFTPQCELTALLLYSTRD